MKLSRPSLLDASSTKTTSEATLHSICGDAVVPLEEVGEGGGVRLLVIIAATVSGSLSSIVDGNSHALMYVFIIYLRYMPKYLIIRYIRTTLKTVNVKCTGPQDNNTKCPVEKNV